MLKPPKDMLEHLERTYTLTRYSNIDYEKVKSLMNIKALLTIRDNAVLKLRKALYGLKQA